MKIVMLDEFVKLPDGTVFSYYEPAIVRGLFVKGATLDSDIGDFFLTPVFPQQYAADSPALTDEIGMKERWGEMDPDAQFAVYDDIDMAKMVGLLSNRDEWYTVVADGRLGKRIGMDDRGWIYLGFPTFHEPAWFHPSHLVRAHG